MHKNTKKLAAYSLASFSYLALQTHGNAQVIYTDIDPDIILDSDLESTGVDMDNDGIFDFGFIEVNYKTYWCYECSSIRIIKALVGPLAFDNSIAASLTYYSSEPVCFPNVLNKNSLIDSNLNFENWGYQLLALKATYYFFSNISFDIHLGNWYPSELNKFVGVHFRDAEGSFHYGWIRCSIAKKGKKIEIKDYAFELNPNTSIAAGDKIGDTSIIAGVPILSLASASIYATNNTVVINLPFLQADASIHIYNTTGQEVYAATTKNNITTIPLNVAAGIYLVEVISGENRVSKKVVVN